MSVETLNYLLAAGTIGLQLFTIVLIAVYVFRAKKALFSDIARSLQTWGLTLALALSAVASALTLYYSDVLGFSPCPLCWWQRACLYPLVPLLALALWKRDVRIADYAIVLSVIGGVIALYQHALQMFGEGSLPCPAAPDAVSCAQRILFEFGYVTFPLMAASVFAFLIALMLFVRKSR